jgi:hypothetical protein
VKLIAATRQFALYISNSRIAGMEGNMFAPFTHHEGWQAIFRRVIQQQQKVAPHNLMTLGDHDPDRRSVELKLA